MEVESNRQPLAQLGSINHPIFGRAEASFITQLNLGSNPIFGQYRQQFEDQEDQTDVNLIQENETVKSVYLEIPFFSNTHIFKADPIVIEKLKEQNKLLKNDKLNIFKTTGFKDFKKSNLSSKEKDAFDILELNYSAKWQEIQQKFKYLVKKYHPDKNQGNKKFEDKLKKITLAYSQLKKTLGKK